MLHEHVPRRGSPPPSFETKSNGAADGPAPVRTVLEKE